MRLPEGFLFGVRFLGSGVAIEVACPGLLKLRRHLAREWEQWLGAQDKGGYRPHITIQNKVDAAEARRFFESLREEWVPFAGKAEGLYLWHYRGGSMGTCGRIFVHKGGCLNRGESLLSPCSLFHRSDGRLYYTYHHRFFVMCSC